MSIMFRIDHEYCQKRLSAYIDGNTAVRSRHRISRHLDSCPSCYSDFVRLHAQQRELESGFWAFGSPPALALDNLWTTIQSRTQSDAAFRLPRRIWIQIATLAVLIVFLLPILAAETPSNAGTVTLPSPRTVALEATPGCNWRVSA